MNNGVCPKCGSHQVYYGSSSDGEGLAAGTYTSVIEISTGKTQTTLWVDTYICRICGYLEMHVTNRADLEVLLEAEGWVKVAPVSESVNSLMEMKK